MKDRYLFLVLFVLLFFVVSSDVTSYQLQGADESVAEDVMDVGITGLKQLVSYSTHDPIVIANDSDLIDQATTEGWSGDGSEGNPYLIENLEIRTTDSCISITDVSLHFVIQNCFLGSDVGWSFGHGVFLDNATHASIESCIIDTKSDGVSAQESPECYLFNNTVQTGDFGFMLSSSPNCTLKDNIVDITWGLGAWIDNSPGCILSNNSMISSYEGVNIWNSSNCTLIDNNLRGTETGIVIYDSSFCELTGNTLEGDGQYDLLLGYSVQCNLTDNFFQARGLRLEGWMIEHWVHEMTGNLVRGRPLAYFVDLENSAMDVSGYGQAILVNGTNVILRDGSFSSVSNGMTMVYCDTCAFINNTVDDNANAGIYIEESNNCSSIDNRLAGNGNYGVMVQSSSYTTILNNNISETEYSGLWISGSPYCTVNESEFVNDGVYFQGWSLEYWQHTVYDNTVNGKPLGYYWNVSDMAIDGASLGQVFVVNSTRIAVNGGSFHDCPIAVNLAYCTDCEISDAVVADSGMHGLAVMESQNCTVFNCTTYDNSNSGIMCSNSPNCTLDANMAYGNNVGISVDSSPSTTVSNNTIYDQGYVGIDCWGMDNGTIWNNTAWGSRKGILIRWAQNCTVSNNTVANNWYVGLELEGCSFCEVTYNGAFASEYYGIRLHFDSHNNTFFGNEFAANDQYNALDDGYDNTWDDGVSMGNGWSDYVGPGAYSIPGTAGSVDNYPWLFVDTVPPTIDHPADIELGLGGTGCFITWHPIDYFPDHYDLYVDEVVVESDMWEGDPIMIWVTPSKVSILNYTLVVFDQGGLSTGDTVLVNVSTAPGALLITSNSDFVTQDWPGSGTEMDPYIIEGLDITLNATTAYIGDVDAHFVIRGSSFSSLAAHFGIGIIFNNVTNGQVESCNITWKAIGIYISGSNKCTVWNNIIYDNHDAGVYATGTANLTITENEVYNSTNCVEISSSSSIDVINNTIYEGHVFGVCIASSPGTIVSLNTVHHVGALNGPMMSIVAFMMSPGCTASNNTLHSGAIGITAGMSPGCIIANNTIYDILMGTYIYASGSCVVTDNALSNSGFLIYGMTPAESYMVASGNTVNGKPLGYVWNSTGEVVDGNLYGQVLIANSTGVTVNGGSFDNCTLGVALAFCQDCHIIDVDSMNSYLSLAISNSNDTSVTNCALNGSLMGCIVQNAWNCTVDNNEIYGNQMIGLQFSESYNCTITHNWIYENGGPGIMMSGSNNTLFGNKIGWNGGPMYGDYNAMDSGSSNTWDDGVSAGNAWHDYSGTGVYSIYGMAGSVDRYPSLLTDVWSPDIDSPSDLEYEEGAAGNLITWTPSHPRPDHYELYRNGSLLGSWVWDGSPIVADVDGFSVGVYNYTVMVYNERGYNSTDTVFVTVVDGTPPTIDSPSDITYELGTTGNSITWTPSDLHPDHYELYRNDSLLGSWVWDGSPIVVDVDGFGVSTYNYTLTVYDIGDNTVSDTVFVSVVDTTPPTIDSPSDVNYELGTTGNSITWTPSDLDPDHYELYQNDSLLGSWVWDGSPIVVDVDGLGVSTYNYTLTVYDVGDNTISDTVFVSVEDTTPPDWVVSPSDQSIDYGQALEYQLQATDLSGIGAWYVNDTANFAISGTGLVTNESILEVGDYGLNISVEDIYGNTRSFTIRIRVLSSTTTTTTTTTTTETTSTEEIPPLDPMVLVIVIGIGAGVIVIIIIVAIKRKR